MPRQGDVIWHDLTTPDQEVSGTFFKELLGWDLKPVDAGEFGTYTLFQRDGQDLAGMMNPVRESPLSQAHESRWHMYISVDDVDQCAQRVVDLGGTVLVPPHDVPGIGRACLIAEPFGADVVLLTPTTDNDTT